jgi:hypothetical protein
VLGSYPETRNNLSGLKNQQGEGALKRFSLGLLCGLGGYLVTAVLMKVLTKQNEIGPLRVSFRGMDLLDDFGRIKRMTLGEGGAPPLTPINVLIRLKGL